ncbi:MAG: hypothetical protein U0271_01810 [Polyangiaceae bacterium]
MGFGFERGWGLAVFLGVAGCLVAEDRVPVDTTRGSSATQREPEPALPVSSGVPLEPVSDSSESATPVAANDWLVEDSMLRALGSRDEEWSALCAPELATDAASRRLCAARARLGSSWPSSFGDVLAALGLAFTSAVGNGELGNPSFALLSHSTSLSGRVVSPINPRVFLFTNPATEGPIAGNPKPDPDMIAVAFTRGEPLVEIVARGAGGELRFLLLRFELACEAEAGGCSDADRFGPSIETGWLGATPYSGEALRNTTMDCEVCHRPAGPDSPAVLRMVERKPPWTHFFRDKEGGRLLLDDYFTAHTNAETYGGIPGALITWSEPARLEGFVEHEGNAEQPVELFTMAVTRLEMRGKDPADEPHYRQILSDAMTGRGLPAPFPATRFADKGALARAAKAYKKVTSTGGEGELVAPSELVTPETDYALGRAVAPEASGEEVVLRACSLCHNGRLDQTLSRSRFDATRLGEMPASERERAAERLRLPSSSPLAMPPARFVSLGDSQRERAIAALLAPAGD